MNEDYLSVNVWLPKQRTTFLYDANTDLIEKYTEDNASGWTNTNRYTYTLNNGLVNEELYYLGNGNAWNNSSKTIYNYNINNDITFKQVDNYIGPGYTPYTRDFYYYNTFVVGLNYSDLDIENILLYPNPSNKQISVQMHMTENRQLQYSLVDMLGRIRYMTIEQVNKGSHTTHINVEYMPAGNYFIVISDTQTGKKQVAKVQIVH
jgi:phenylpyruvate tautomerase PptA (4-oxalocrotonate tautomerase family)